MHLGGQGQTIERRRLRKIGSTKRGKKKENCNRAVQKDHSPGRQADLKKLCDQNLVTLAD